MTISDCGEYLGELPGKPCPKCSKTAECYMAGVKLPMPGPLGCLFYGAWRNIYRCECGHEWDEHGRIPEDNGKSPSIQEP